MLLEKLPLLLDFPLEVEDVERLPLPPVPPPPLFFADFPALTKNS